MSSLLNFIFFVLIFFYKTSRANVSGDSSNSCQGSSFLKFIQGAIPGDRPRRYQFIFVLKLDENEWYEHNTKLAVRCAPAHQFSFPFPSKSLICSHGEVKQDEVSEFNHCIRNDQCSAGLFDRDWVIKGYKIHNTWQTFMKDHALISDSMPVMSNEQAQREAGRADRLKSPERVWDSFSPKGSTATYPPYLKLGCTLVYKLGSNDGGSKIAPHAYCEKQPQWKTAKWTDGPFDDFSRFHVKCFSIPAAVTNLFRSPPPFGCSVYDSDKTECKKYKNYCVYSTKNKQNMRYLDPTKIEVRICNKRCVPWSCYNAIRDPIPCEKENSLAECERDNPLFGYWCEWDAKEALCSPKKLDLSRLSATHKHVAIQVEICTTDQATCRRSKTHEWWSQEDADFNGRVERLGMLRFGFAYRLFGVRHAVSPLKALTELRGFVTTTVTATQEMVDDPHVPEKPVTLAPILIKPNEVKTSFSMATRLKFKLIFATFSSLGNKLSGNDKNPYPKHEYVTVELQSAELDLNSPPISFYLHTYTSPKCSNCKLEKKTTSGRGASQNTVTQTMYTMHVSPETDAAMCRVAMPSLKKPDVTLKGKIKCEPGPERCGKNDLGCYITLTPEMNDVASALVQFKAVLPLRARINGMDDSNVLVWGTKPSKRRQTQSKYKIKISKAIDFTEYVGQVALVRFSIDLGLVKSVKLSRSALPRYEKTVEAATKIEWKTKDALKMTPNNYKSVILMAKKPMPVKCRLSWHCNACGMQVKPSNIWIDKGFSFARLTIKGVEPGTFQMHFQVIGECADVVADPPSLQLEVFQPTAGYVRVPEEIGPMQSDAWSDEVTVELTRSPFRRRLVIQPLTQEFAFKPKALIYETSPSLGFQQKSKKIKFKFVGDCGGGPPREVKWRLSGAVDEFYRPGSSYINVVPSDEDSDYCLAKLALASSNATSNITMDMEMEMDVDSNHVETPQGINVNEWQFEYYLVGAACTVCLLVVVDTFKQSKFDRLIAIMSATLQ